MGVNGEFKCIPYFILGIWKNVIKIFGRVQMKFGFELKKKVICCIQTFFFAFFLKKSQIEKCAFIAILHILTEMNLECVNKFELS